MRDPAPGRGRSVGVLPAIVGLAIFLAATFALTIDRTPTAEAGAANLGALAAYWCGFGFGWLGLSLLAVRLWRDRASSWSSARHAAWVVLAVAAAARVVLLLTQTPQLSDDVYRYVFDGRNAAAGVNPYLVRPADRLGVVADPLLERPVGLIEMTAPTATPVEPRWPGEAAVAARVNNPELHTIYLPVSQYVFAATAWLTPASWSDADAAALAFRIVLVGFELGAIGLLLLVLRRQDRSPWWAALYAWHPLALGEIAGSGHQDAIGLFLLVLALALATWWRSRVAPWTVALACAAMVKPVVVPVAALLLRGQAWYRWVGSALIGVIVCAAVSAPLMLTHGGAPGDNWRSTADRFAKKWAHFGSVYEPVLTAVESRTPRWTNDEQEILARQVCGGLLGVVVLAILVMARDPWSGARAMMLAMVLLSSTAHPWYLLWALILMPGATSTRGAMAVWAASLTLPWGYAQLVDVVDWTVPSWVMVAAYLPVYAALLHDMVSAIRRRRHAGDEAIP